LDTYHENDEYELQGAQRDTILCEGCQEEELGEDEGGAQMLKAQLMVNQVPHLKKAN